MLSCAEKFVYDVRVYVFYVLLYGFFCGVLCVCVDVVGVLVRVIYRVLYLGGGSLCMSECSG